MNHFMEKQKLAAIATRRRWLSTVMALVMLLGLAVVGVGCEEAPAEASGDGEEQLDDDFEELDMEEFDEAFGEIEEQAEVDEIVDEESEDGEVAAGVAEEAAAADGAEQQAGEAAEEESADD